jgi:hypothetical protein
MAERDCTCAEAEITTAVDLARNERVYIRGASSEDCPYHGYRKVYVGPGGKHYPTRAEAGWNVPEERR